MSFKNSMNDLQLLHVESTNNLRFLSTLERSAPKFLAVLPACWSDLSYKICFSKKQTTKPISVALQHVLI